LQNRYILRVSAPFLRVVNRYKITAAKWFIKLLNSTYLKKGQLTRFTLGLLSILLACVVVPVLAAPAMVWSQQDGEDINLYFSPDGVTSIALTSGGQNIMPGIGRNETQSWLSWVDASDGMGTYKLKYAQVADNGLILMSGDVLTAVASLYAPAIAPDPSGRRVWLVWVENQGKTAELFVSYLDIQRRGGAAWATPLQITPDDEFSANLPSIIEVGFEQIKISWMRSAVRVEQLATAEVNVRDWAASAAGMPALLANPDWKPRLAGIRAQYKALKREDLRVMRLDRQSYSAEARSWSQLTRGNKVLMGAFVDGGVVTRVIGEQ